MKSEQIKEITDKDTEHLVAASRRPAVKRSPAISKPSDASTTTACTMSCSSLRKNRTPVPSLVSVRGTSWAAS